MAPPPTRSGVPHPSAPAPGRPTAVCRRPFALVVLAALGLVAAACSSTINGATLNQEVAAQLAAQQQLPASEVSVDCPDTIDAAEGSVTRCAATLAGEPAEVDVTQVDGSGTVEWVLVVPEEPATP